MFIDESTSLWWSSYSRPSIVSPLLVAEVDALRRIILGLLPFWSAFYLVEKMPLSSAFVNVVVLVVVMVVVVVVVRWNRSYREM